ncbi:MAG: VOC family protein, partial [Chitinophagaceae bacterium]
MLIFKWLNKDLNTPGHTAFSFFKEDTSYFSPSVKPFMINFRVKDLDVLLAELKKEGVEIVGEKEEYEYGNFGWIM